MMVCSRKCPWKKSNVYQGMNIGLQKTVKRAQTTRVEHNDPISVLIYEIEDIVPELRFSELVLATEKLDDAPKICFDFLTERERKLLESVIAAWQLDGHMNCIAHYQIELDSGECLDFEAFIEDDGTSLRMRTTLVRTCLIVWGNTS